MLFEEKRQELMKVTGLDEEEMAGLAPIAILPWFTDAEVEYAFSKNLIINEQILNLIRSNLANVQNSGELFDTTSLEIVYFPKETKDALLSFMSNEQFVLLVDKIAKQKDSFRCYTLMDRVELALFEFATALQQEVEKVRLVGWTPASVVSTLEAKIMLGRLGELSEYFSEGSVELLQSLISLFRPDLDKKD